MLKEKEVVCQLPGRDFGAKFLITEMPASRAEKWAARAILALSNAGIELPDELQGAGMAVMAAAGLQALGRVKFADAEPLLDEMMGCVQSVQEHITRPLIEEDIEEVATRLWLRSEVFEVHSGFSILAAISSSRATREQRKSSRTTRTSRSR